MENQLFTVVEDSACEPALHTVPETDSVRKAAAAALITKVAIEGAFDDMRPIPHIAHEVKTRLNAIIGFSEILKVSVHDTTLRHYISIIRTSGEALLTLVNNGYTKLTAAPDDHALVVRERGTEHADYARPEQAGFAALAEARSEWESLLDHGKLETDRTVVFAVDDNEDNLAIIAHLFAKENIRMFAFSNGHELLEAIQLVTPSLILLDVVMPAMDGYEVCRRLKNNAQTEHIPVIFLTGKTDPDDIVQGFHAGGVDYIAKPFRKEELLSRVHTHLTLHETQRSLKNAVREKDVLLDETLKGSIRVLIDILAMTNPDAFAQTIRVRSIAKKMAMRLGLENVWEIEIGVLLSHLGCALLPQEIVSKKQAGRRLTTQENTIFNSHPKTAARFIANIPRLEQVAESILNQFADYDPVLGADIIKDFIRIVFDYDNLIQSGNTQQQALDQMNGATQRYNPLVLGALEAEVRRLIDGCVVRTVQFDELKPGMIIADDIRNASNLILVRRNSELSEVLLEKLQNLRYCGRTYDPVKILEHVN